eukprot:5617200-Pleurochrysis_carterae.AAC.2
MAVGCAPSLIGPFKPFKFTGSRNWALYFDMHQGTSDFGLSSCIQEQVPHRAALLPCAQPWQP